MPKAKKQQPGFEQLLQQLETTVDDLTQGQLTLEQMLEKYTAGLELLQACRGILQQAEQGLPHEPEEDPLWS